MDAAQSRWAVTPEVRRAGRRKMDVVLPVARLLRAVIPPAGRRLATWHLHTAVIHDDEAALTELLDLGADPSRLWRHPLVPAIVTTTPLLAAAMAGRIGCLTRLLDAGADPNGSPQHGTTALLWAAQEGHDECIALLLDRGADVDAQETEGVRYTALMRAACGGRLDTVRLLLERGADRSDLMAGGVDVVEFARRLAARGELPHSTAILACADLIDGWTA